MKNKEPKVYDHCFNPGDLCRGQDGDMFVIIKVENNEYFLIQLQDRTINLLGEPPITTRKGDVARQHVTVFDKYHYLYQPQ